MIGAVSDIDEIDLGLFPHWREVAQDPNTPFALRRRLLAAAMERHIHAAEAPRDYVDEYVTVPGRDIPIRIYGSNAAQELPTTVYFHGGGWVSGNLDTHHGICRVLREQLGGVVVSVHCRRAPENPFPAQLEDALCAIDFVESRNGLVGAGSKGLVLAGDSAGALIALHGALALAERGSVLGLLLLYPALDPDVDKESYRVHAEAPGLAADTMRQYWDALLGNKQELRSALALDAIACIERLPPTAIMVAEFDPLRDDGIKLASMLTARQRPVVAITATGTTHGFCRLVEIEPAAKAWLETLVAAYSGMLRRQVRSTHSPDSNGTPREFG